MGNESGPIGTVNGRFYSGEEPEKTRVAIDLSWLPTVDIVEPPAQFALRDERITVAHHRADFTLNQTGFIACSS